MSLEETHKKLLPLLWDFWGLILFQEFTCLFHTSQMLAEVRVSSLWDATWDTLWGFAFSLVIYFGMKYVENGKRESFSIKMNRKVPSPGFTYGRGKSCLGWLYRLPRQAGEWDSGSQNTLVRSQDKPLRQMVWITFWKCWSLSLLWLQVAPPQLHLEYMPDFEMAKFER